MQWAFSKGSAGKLPAELSEFCDAKAIGVSVVELRRLPAVYVWRLLNQLSTVARVRQGLEGDGTDNGT